MLVAAITAGGAIASPPAPALLPAKGTCPDVTFIGARGSGEAEDKVTHGMGPPVYHMAKRMSTKLEVVGETMTRLPITYTAAGVETLKPTAGQLALLAAGHAGEAAALYYNSNLRKYLASIAEGTALAMQAIKHVVASCQDTDIIVAGYSQGAIAVHQAELKLEAAGDTDATDAIIGTLLLGDGDRIPNSAAHLVGSSANTAQGIRTYAPGGKARDVIDPELTANICDKQDIVCDFNLSRLRHFPTAAKVHTGYLSPRKGAVLDAAVDWLADQILEPGAP
jgi:hypothetical protein